MCNAFRRERLSLTQPAQGCGLWRGGHARLRGGPSLRCCKRDEASRADQGVRPASALATVTAESKGRIFKSKSKDWESNK